jgi:hypothetical protein
MACIDDAPLKFTPGFAIDEVHAHATRRSCQFTGLGFPGRLMGRDSPAMWGGASSGAGLPHHRWGWGWVERSPYSETRILEREWMGLQSRLGRGIDGVDAQELGSVSIH